MWCKAFAVFTSPFGLASFSGWWRMTTRILIAGDNAVAQVRLTALIQSHDYWDVCTVAKDGQNAVLRAIESKPDIIILDLAMPVMDGLSAAREIGKVLPSTPTLYPPEISHGVRSEEGRNSEGCVETWY